MDWSILFTCVLIFCARICDVSLGTLRTVSVINGRGGVAWMLGFVEVLIWVFAVSNVIANLSHPAYAVAYALGFATGNYVGVRIEQWVAYGRQIVRVFTRRGAEIAAALRGAGFGVTQFDGHGRDGPVQSLLIETRRRGVGEIIDRARTIDESCYYTVEDIKRVSSADASRQQRGGPLGVLKRK